MLAVPERISKTLLEKAKEIAEDCSLNGHEKMKRIISVSTITSGPNGYP